MREKQESADNEFCTDKLPDLVNAFFHYFVKNSIAY